MKFDTIDAFLQHFYANNLNIADVDFGIVEVSDEVQPVDDVPATPDVVAPPVDDVDDEKEELIERCTLMLASGELEAEFDKDGYLLVDECEMTPNACGTGTVLIDGRRLHLNMCQMEGDTVAYFHTKNGTREPVKVRVKN